jgi:dephospho-CoA kinase
MSYRSVQSFILSGLSGAGKTTAKEYLAARGYETISVGDVVQKQYDKEATESVAEFVRRKHECEGLACFTKSAIATLERRVTEQTDGVVIEGVHSASAVRCVREAFGWTPIVWIDAPQRLRLQRVRRRSEDTLDHIELLQRDLRELNSGLSELTPPFGCDYVLNNDSSLAAFKTELAATLQ